jgi:polyribonucleotide nucleotidyltransferase
VPVSAACAGIAMGLITDPSDKRNYRVLTDIQGIEDHSGDMDFKIAGTETGVTAVQLDIKLGGISLEVIEKTLQQSREARLKILDVMAKAISAPRSDLSPYAPRILSLSIPVDKIREVIGSGGKIINEIIDTCGVEAIDIDDDGLVVITSLNAEGAQKAKEWVESIVKEVEVGEIYAGPVTQIVTDRNSGEEIGAIVEIAKGKDGMVHISQFKYERINRVSDVVKVGDVIKVKVMEIDQARGRISLSAKALLTAPPFDPSQGPDVHRGGPRDRFRPRHSGSNGRFNDRPRR